jgi:hypothetical protein
MSAHVVVASVAEHSPAVTDQFLLGLDRLGAPGADISFLFADTGHDPRSSQLLARFAEKSQRGEILHCSGADDAKEALLARATGGDITHVLLVASNLVLPPPLLGHLVSLGLDVVSEVFWTEWQPGTTPLPNVWASDQYNFFGPQLARGGADAQLAAANAFLAQLSQPGTYPVGGLGNCTLISRAALGAGVSFKPVPNVSFWGDDRHFSIRAAALGLSLWADTYYPPLHIYRETDLGMALQFWSKWHTAKGEAA